MTVQNLSSLQENFMAAAGEVAEMFSFNRSIGVLYGLLYLSSQPRSLDEVAKVTRMSKGSASVHLRTLEAWGAVRCSWKPGIRKDYYEANTDLRGLALKRLHEGVGKRLEVVRRRLNQMKVSSEAAPRSSEPLRPEEETRLREIEKLLCEIEKGFSLLPKLLKLKGLLRA